MTGTHIALLLLGGCSTDGWCTRFNLDCGTTLPEIVASVDADDDVWNADEDCDDNDPTVNPSATETWYDSIDQDCAGDSDWDADGDGHDAAWRPDGTGGDCDDGNPAVHPDATERWYDGVDDDCDGNLHDADGDGQDGTQGGGADCDDQDPDVYYGAPETWYDGVDQDCNPATEYDADGDGWDSAAHGGSDCDDAARFTSPAQAEICDGQDDDCDGDIDEGGICDSQARVRTIIGIDTRNPEIWTTPNIAAASDTDGDGASELVFSSENIGDGRAWLLTVGDATETTVGAATGRIAAEGSGQGLGMSPVGGRDLDGDGMQDLLLGGLDPEAAAFSNRGVVWVFHGPVTGELDSTDADATWTGPASSALLGRQVRAHGDLDGDGTEDLLALQENGAILEDGAEGTALLLLPGDAEGAADAMDGAIATLGMDLDGDGSSDGWVSQTDGTAAADLDGDGVLDLILGLPYLGVPGGLGVHIGPIEGDRFDIDVVAVAPGTRNTQVGWSVAVAGDLDGDGTPDLGIGAPGEGPSSNGEVWLVAAGSVLDADLSDRLGAAQADAYEALGTHLSAVGDMDGDGTPDLIASRQYEPVRFISGATRGELSLTTEHQMVPDWVPGLGYAHRARSVGDLDDDGRAEILVALVPSTAVGLLLDGDGWSSP